MPILPGLDRSAADVLERRRFMAVIAVAFRRGARHLGTTREEGGLGHLSRNPPSDTEEAIDAFRKRLRDFGYVEGHNLILDYRYAEGRFEKFPMGLAGVASLKASLWESCDSTGCLREAVRTHPGRPLSPARAESSFHSWRAGG
jgi:hypothetical protein